jgi:hypothetical protein|tara:strand:+ start:2266 stop:2913 length:648 start_codon:yes stop_codon:yes gene_type:complete
MSFTYSSLKTAIQDYTENTETSFVAHMDDFIKLSEERILKNVQLQLFRKNVTGTMTSSNQYLAAPSDFLAPFSLSITSSSVKDFLQYKDVNFVQSFNPNSATTGTPRYYALFDITNFIIGPTPDSEYVTEMHYFYRPASLTAAGDSGTTWLSENATLALLYGCLTEAYTYMKGEQDLMAEYEKRFGESMVALKMFGEAKEVTEDYRAGMVIRPKQ